MFFDRDNLRAEMVSCRHITSHADAGESFDEDLRGTARRPRELRYARYNAASIEVGCGRLVGITASLRDQEDVAVFRHRTVDGRE